MTLPPRLPANHPMNEILQRGHKVPSSVEHLLNESHKRGVQVKLVFPEDGRPEPEAKDCFTLVYGIEPPGFTCKPTLKALRKAMDEYNLKAKQKISFALRPKEMKQLQAHGARIQKGAHVVQNDGGALNVQSNTRGHVLAVPRTGQVKVPSKVLRGIIGVHDINEARDRAEKQQLKGYQSGEITPFLGPDGQQMGFHFDEATVRHNPWVRFYHGKDYSVVMRYGDAFRIIQGAYPSRANLVEFFPREPEDKGGEKLLFKSLFRVKAFAADLKAHNNRTKSNVEISLDESQMTKLRKGAELEIGNYVLRHKNNALHVYLKPR